MLRHLHIQNLALIEEIALDFEEGLTVFTGESGAGKSIVLDAIMLLAGMRASPSMIRSGKDRATLEAVWEIPVEHPALKWLEENGLEDSDEDESGPSPASRVVNACPDNASPVSAPRRGAARSETISQPAREVILRREIHSSGRGRAWINGRLVPASALESLSGHLLEIHGQMEHQAFLDPGAQRDFYDSLLGLGPLREQVRLACQQVLDAQRQIDALQADGRDIEQRRDFLAFQIGELRSLNLCLGEQEALESERKRLVHAEELRAAAESIRAALCESGSEQRSALELAGASAVQLRRMVRCDNNLAPLAESLEGALAQMEDTAREVGRYLDRLDADPARLSEIEERLETLRRVLRKHGPSEEEAIERLRVLEAERAGLENRDAAMRDANSCLEAARERLTRAAADLSAARERGRRKFLRPFSAMLKEFALPDAKVDIQMRPASHGVKLSEAGPLCGPEGAEDLEILFCANPGEPLQPLRRVVSGGELSRVALALRALGADLSDASTLVFDEVDAGVSGVAARRIAERLAALGQRRQVIYVTHQAAVASAANRHIVIGKEIRSGRAITWAREVEQAERRRELARLLDGGQHSDASLALAAEMLEAAG